MDLTSQNTVSSATLRNWKRLNVDIMGRLTKRNNKTASDRNVLPKNYIEDNLHRANIEYAITVLLQSQRETCDIIYTLCVCKLRLFNKSNRNGVNIVLDKYGKKYKYIDQIGIDTSILETQYDTIGYIYQALNSEGVRNALGQYYTSKDIVATMTDGIFVDNEVFLDPCCGSGSFLMNISTSNPQNLYGVDIDELSVLIATTNLMCKYENIDFVPNIYCFDFLADTDMYSSAEELRIHSMEFDYIFTNPPWGTERGIVRNSNMINSREKSSLFLEKSVALLKRSGRLKFLLPSSILKIKNHRDIRKFILEKTIVRSIRFFEKSRFSGVFTDFISIDIENTLPKGIQSYTVQKGGKSYVASVNPTGMDFVISTADGLYEVIWNKVYKLRNDDLSHSIWGLGIVTGDNKNKLANSPLEGYERIFTGKDVLRYKIGNGSKYLLYNRNTLQQCTKDEIYRAKEKLIYKFISRVPVFAYDNQRRLCLNSANILIPSVQSLSIKSVMAILNSELYQFLYMLKFDDVKILKSNLASLPLPKLTPAEDRYLNECTDRVLAGEENIQRDIDLFIYKFFNIDDREQTYIKEKLWKTLPKH